MSNDTSTNAKDAGPFDVSGSLLERLADTMTKAELTEIEFVDGDRSLRLTKTPAQVFSAPAPMASAMPTPMAAPALAPTAPAASTMASGAGSGGSAAQSAPMMDGTAIKSPMVGTGYLSPEPGKPAFVAVGDKVSKGQTLMIIEAMKVMNPLPCPMDGVIKAILISDGEPVEFDQTVMVLG